jgi:hypothetical protein
MNMQEMNNELTIIQLSELILLVNNQKATILREVINDIKRNKIKTIMIDITNPLICYIDCLVSLSEIIDINELGFIKKLYKKFNCEISKNEFYEMKLKLLNLISFHKINYQKDHDEIDSSILYKLEFIQDSFDRIYHIKGIDLDTENDDLFEDSDLFDDNIVSFDDDLLENDDQEEETFDDDFLKDDK